MRLFVALDIPDDIKSALVPLSAGLKGARPIPPENLHITLAFLGDVSRDQAEDLHDALCHLPEFYIDIHIAGLNMFATGDQARTLWAAVDRSPDLLAVQKSVASAIRKAGVRLEARKFIPHVTLARLNSAEISTVQSHIAAHTLFDPFTFTTSAVSLYESALRQDGSVYTVLQTYP